MFLMQSGCKMITQFDNRSFSVFSNCETTPLDRVIRHERHKYAATNAVVVQDCCVGEWYVHQINLEDF